MSGAPTTPLATQADLEQRFGRSRILQLVDNEITGSISDTAVVQKIAAALLEATHLGLAFLGNAWRVEDVIALTNGAAGTTRDLAMVGAFCDLAMEVLALNRQEFIKDDGTTLYTPRALRAEKLFLSYARRQNSPANSPPVQKNRTIGTTTNRPTRPLIFQGDSDNPNGKGGF